MVDIKKMIENKKALSLLLLTLVLASCGNNQSTSDSITNSDSQIKTQDVQQDLGDNSEDVSVDGKLTINSKCIGCGHCVRFSSTNFSMNTSTHKAEVISQENITSNDIEKAIERCPVSAISIS